MKTVKVDVTVRNADELLRFTIRHDAGEFLEGFNFKYKGSFYEYLMYKANIAYWILTGDCVTPRKRRLISKRFWRLVADDL